MREIFILLKANIRSAKKSFISIVLLLFIMSLSITAVMTVKENSSSRVSKAMKEDGFGDLWAAFVDVQVREKGTTIEELERKTKECSVVDKVHTTEIIYADLWEINEDNSNNSILFATQGDGGIRYKFFEKSGKRFMKNEPVIKKGETAVPICLQSLYNCKLGDVVRIDVNGEIYDLTVKYFIEDPIMGSSMMGLKTFLISDEDMEYMKGICDNTPKGTIGKGAVFHIFQKEASNLSGITFEQQINKETGLTSYTFVKLTASQASGYMLILVNIFSGILIVFVVLLMVVALIIIGHNITNSMEMDYMNMGVLKALGFNADKLKMVYVLQYMCVVFLGSILGIPCAIPIVRLVNELMKPVIGVHVSTAISYGSCIRILFGINCIIIFFIAFKLKKIAKITPVRAIRGGQNEVYFKSRVQLNIRQKGLDCWLAIRQVTSNKRQYISGCLIAALLVFFLGMTSSMKSFVGSDGKKMNRMFAPYEEDFTILYMDKSVRDEVERKIEEYTPILSIHGAFNQYLSIEGSQIQAIIVQEPEMLHNILKGRVCKYDNEIVVTEFLVKELGVKMGDTLTIQSGERKEEYIISGYYQNANDMGTNFAMSGNGYERLTGRESNERWVMVYNIEDEDLIETICEDLKKQYGDEVIRVNYGNFSGVDTVVHVVDAIVVVIYVIAAIFVLIAVFLICSKMYLKEQKDYGIYKAIGFSSARLRRQFAVRFTVVAFLGSVTGMILYLLLGNMGGAAIFYFVGVSSFEANTGFVPLIVPFIFVTGLFGIFSWLAAARIRKAEPRILIQE